MSQFIIGVVRVDGRVAYLRWDMWSACKADATRYPTAEAAQEMARHWLSGLPNLRRWHIEQVEG